MTPARRRTPVDDRGVQATMVAVIFPGLLALVFLTVQAGVYYHARQWAATASDRAANQAAEHGAVPAQVESDMLAFLPDHFCADGWSVSVGPSSDGDSMTAVVSCAAPGPLAPWQVSSRSSAPIERFIPETERS
jgi:hypothetical protein